MRSFAIWYDKKENCTESDKKPEIQVHINLWEKNICGGKRGEVYFDFGFLIHCLDTVARVNLYCPFNIQECDVVDLGEQIYKNDDLVNTIFNEDYEPKKIASATRYLSVHVPLSRKNAWKDDFLIYQLNEDNFKVSYVPGNKGSILSLDLKDVLPQEHHKYYEDLKDFKRHYFRFRISVDATMVKMISHRPKNISPFQDAFIETQIIDFRLNNLRSCNASIGDTFAKGEHFNIVAIHYLVLRNVSDEIIYHGKNISSRLLEKEAWTEYFGKLHSNVMAYHFKEVRKKNSSSENVDIEDSQLDVGIDEFVILTRFDYQNWNFCLILGYLYLLIYVGCLASFVSTLLFNQSPTNFGLFAIIFGGAVAAGVAYGIYNGQKGGADSG